MKSMKASFRAGSRDAAFLLAALLCVSAAGCSGGSSGAINERAAAVQRARDAVAALSSTLMGELQAAMKENGTAGAVEYCDRNAQRITHEVADRRDVGIRRISARWRNAGNEPDAFESDVLARFQREKDAGVLTSETIFTDVGTHDGRRVLRFLEPIIVRPVCLQCHGDERTIDPNAARKIRERYPDDRATGYRTGDLRGAVSVVVELN